MGRRKSSLNVVSFGIQIMIIMIVFVFKILSCFLGIFIKKSSRINDKKFKSRLDERIANGETLGYRLTKKQLQYIKDNYSEFYYIWEPSSSITPDPLHGLLYGRKFKVGTGDKDDNMPHERKGCQCGMRILTRDDIDYKDTPVHDSKAEYKRIAW